jgi:hypothetical protein
MLAPQILRGEPEARGRPLLDEGPGKGFPEPSGHMPAHGPRPSTGQAWLSSLCRGAKISHQTPVLQISAFAASSTRPGSRFSTRPGKPRGSRRKQMSKERGKQVITRDCEAIFRLDPNAHYAFTPVLVLPDTFFRRPGLLQPGRRKSCLTHGAVAAGSAPKSNSVPSSHIRCMMTASLRATAT